MAAVTGGRVMRKKRVLVVCGTGIATSTVVAEKVANALRSHGIDAELIQCKVTEVPNYLSDTDLIVATTVVGDTRGVPVVPAVSLLTGVGEQQVIDKIVQALSAAQR